MAVGREDEGLGMRNGEQYLIPHSSSLIPFSPNFLVQYSKTGFCAYYLVVPSGLEPDRALKNCPVEGRALIKHPVGVFSEEPDCSDGREERDCRSGLLIQKKNRISRNYLNTLNINGEL